MTAFKGADFIHKVFLKCLRGFYSSIPILPTDGASRGKPGIAGNDNVKEYGKAVSWIHGSRSRTAWWWRDGILPPTGAHLLQPHSI